MVQLPVITPSTTAIASGETASSVSQIVSAVPKFVTENSPPVSDSVPEWVFFFVVVAIVVSIFGLALRIALWMLKTALRLVCCSLQWLVQAFVRFLGFGSKGVTKGSAAATYQSSRLGQTIPAGSTFSSLQSMGAKQG
ncbi:hypothetical protein EV401DRAFT_2048123 [Pisolithus croceorrhizus]|nr:hypothetical protein EV401DRAFT_2048123 [Pisolithus croceorrhizus]